MKRIIVRYKHGSLKINLSEDNTCILDSYKVKRLDDMREILFSTRHEVLDDMTLAIHNRSVSSMIHEWRVHNLLYCLNIERDRTKSVDLDIGQPWYIKVLYALLSPFYLHFS